jgi:glycosyltransferase involved in cell wall biosynthesis
VGFEGQQYLWTKGFHGGPAFLQDNLVTCHAMIRKSAFHSVAGYDEEIVDGMEDWDFWMRCADHGLWGGTIPEYLNWYRRRANHGDRWRHLQGEKRMQSFRKKLQTSYPYLYDGNFPDVHPRWHMPFDSVPEALPCTNRLDKGARRMLLILPWLTLGGADKFNLDVVEQLSLRGWELSIATTLKGDNSWAPEFARFTPDIHILDHFLSGVDHPRYLRYLIGSRQPDVVLISNSEFGYLILPYLRTHCPGPAYLDYCHMEQEDWKNGGYPRYSVSAQHCLDLSLVSSAHLKGWMVERSGDPEKIEVVYTNIDVDAWCRCPNARERLRGGWGVGEDEPVILFAGRLCSQKQPYVLGHALLELGRRGVGFRAVIVGGGEDRSWLEAFLDEHDLRKRVLSLGPVANDEIRDLMSACDVFFLPSQWEGIALSLFEAMAMELVFVGADVGGQREVFTPDCGVLLPRAGEAEEVVRYADALESVLSDSERRRDLARGARNRVRSEFSLNQMAERLVSLLEGVRTAEHGRPALMRPELAQEWARQAVEYVRMSDVADSLWAEREELKRGGAISAQPEIHWAQVRAAEELNRIEASRSWRAVQRLQRALGTRALVRAPNDGDWENSIPSSDPGKQLARLKASPAYRLIQAVKRTPPYRLYARRRYGPNWDRPTARAQGAPKR